MNKLQANQHVGFSLSGAEIPMSTFISVAKQLADLLQELEAALTGKRSLDWCIENLRMGSAELTVRPSAQSQDTLDSGSAVITFALDGLAVVEDTARRPPHFTDQALRQAKSLVNAAKGDANGLSIFGGSETAHRQVAVSKRLVAHVDELIGAASVAFGSLEGRLEAVTIHDSIAFSIYDSITSRRILCSCSRETLDLAIRHFDKRVSVSGEIKFTVQGDATSMKVDEVRPLGTGALPQARDIRGLFASHKVDINEWSKFVREE